MSTVVTYPGGASPQQRSIRSLPGGGGQMAHRIEVLSLADLRIDARYQRPVHHAKIKQIAERFEEASASLLLVSERADGTYWVVDGQHRLAAMQRLGCLTAPCVVYQGLTLADEARIFSEANTIRATPSYVHVFRARLVAGDAQAQAIFQLVSTFGFVLSEHRRHSGTGGAHVIFAASAIENIYVVSGAEGLRWVLGTIKDAWAARDPRALDSVVLEALGHFYRRYAGQGRLPSDFAEKMRVVGLDTVLRRGLLLREIHRSSVAFNTARAMLIAYNAGKRSRHLPDFFGGAASSGDAVNGTA